MRLPKYIKNEGCFISFTKDWEKSNKKYFHSVEIRNGILIYVNVTQVFLDYLIKSTVYFAKT